MVLRNLVSIDRSSKTPIYLQIVREIVHRIRRGQLSKRAKLPGTAFLGGTLGINRKTIQAAYDELMAQGWIDIFPRKGAFVAAEPPEEQPKAIAARREVGSYPRATSYLFSEKLLARFPDPLSLDSRNLVLDGGLPDVRLAPVAELTREYRNLTRAKVLPKYLRYGDPAGSPRLVETLTSFLRETRCLPISMENLMITRGAQMAFYISARLLLKSGDHVAVGTPGYATVDVMLRQLGAIIDKIPVDSSGIEIDYLESLCSRTALRVVYVMPHHHYPTNATLIPERRIRLLELAAKYGFAIIEDDFDYDFEYDSGPFLPIASLDYNGSVIYVGTLAKTIFPSMRVGFMVAPIEFIQTAVQMRRSIDLQGDTLMEAAIAELYRNGTMKAHIRRAVKVYRARRDHLCALLHDIMGGRVFFDVPTGGMGIWARFPGVDHDRTARIAYAKGLTISDRIVFNPGTDRSDRARLGFASLALSEQERAITILKESLAKAERSSDRRM